MCKGDIVLDIYWKSNSFFTKIPIWSFQLISQSTVFSLYTIDRKLCLPFDAFHCSRGRLQMPKIGYWSDFFDFHAYNVPEPPSWLLHGGFNWQFSKLKKSDTMMFNCAFVLKSWLADYAKIWTWFLSIFCIQTPFSPKLPAFFLLWRSESTSLGLFKDSSIMWQ